MRWPGTGKKEKKPQGEGKEEELRNEGSAEGQGSAWLQGSPERSNPRREEPGEGRGFREEAGPRLQGQVKARRGEGHPLEPEEPEMEDQGLRRRQGPHWELG